LGASQSGSSAFETIGADGKPYSLFTRAFIDGVETGEAAPGRETINLADISKYIYSQRNRSGKATRPYIDVENAMGLLEFARNPKSVEGVRAVAVPTAKPIPHVSPASNSLTAFLRGLRQYLVPLGSAVVLAMAGYFGYQYLYWPGYTLADPSRSGMTWTSSGDYPDNPGIVTVGCSTGGSSGEKCDPINGDAICSIALPLLCFSLVNGKKADWPGEADRKPARWSGGRVQLTAAMVPPAKLSDANRLCSDNFGSDYRVAEFHDSAWVDDSNISDIQNLRNHGWAFQAFGDINSEDRRFWVDVNDQPNGTCWNDRTLVE
ncbi:MAG: hypothetical protein ACE5DK_11535, partial [Paracoccaceae bacterium]